MLDTGASFEAGRRVIDLSREESVTVGLVSDTHGHLDPRIVDAVRECNLCVHAGDVGAGHLLSMLKQAAGRLVAVRGNTEVCRATVVKLAAGHRVALAGVQN